MNTTVMMRNPRHRELEVLARSMLLQSVSITPHRLADRAKINWLVARDILRGLVKKGHATALQNGRFGPAGHERSQSLPRASDQP